MATSPGDMNRVTKANNEVFQRHIRNQDSAGLFKDFYTQDAVVMPQDSPAVSGAEAIGKFWNGMFGVGLRDAVLATERVEASGDLAYEIGRYTLTIGPEGGQTSQATGKYVVVLRRQPDGSWKAVVDMFSANAPAG